MLMFLAWLDSSGPGKCQYQPPNSRNWLDASTPLSQIASKAIDVTPYIILIVF